MASFCNRREQRPIFRVQGPQSSSRDIEIPIRAEPNDTLLFHRNQPLEQYGLAVPIVHVDLFYAYWPEREGGSRRSAVRLGLIEMMPLTESLGHIVQACMHPLVQV